jgi:hypothetical protein
MNVLKRCALLAVSAALATTLVLTANASIYVPSSVSSGVVVTQNAWGITLPTDSAEYRFDPYDVRYAVFIVCSSDPSVTDDLYAFGGQIKLSYTVNTVGDDGGLDLNVVTDDTAADFWGLLSPDQTKGIVAEDLENNTYALVLKVDEGFIPSDASLLKLTLSEYGNAVQSSLKVQAGGLFTNNGTLLIAFDAGGNLDSAKLLAVYARMNVEPKEVAPTTADESNDQQILIVPSPVKGGSETGVTGIAAAIGFALIALVAAIVAAKVKKQ